MMERQGGERCDHVLGGGLAVVTEENGVVVERKKEMVLFHYLFMVFYRDFLNEKARF
nr:hypothetical protein [Evansella caseinilytica]